MRTHLCLVLALAASAVSCQAPPAEIEGRTGRGFALPEGDVERGR